jgi:phosphoribosylglycinamide formyltransferase-1
MSNKIKNIVVFASGKGSNADSIFRYFKNSTCVKVSALFCNKDNAGVLNIARSYGIDTVIFNKENFEDISDKLDNYNPELIILAGFLLQVPEKIIRKYKHKIINIHPSLLPKFGGKGMYGIHVHQAVINAHEAMSGISIHYVNEHYDEGEIIFQQTYQLQPTETAESLQKNIQALEHKYYPQIIEKLLCHE